jgi:ABC-type Fe3+ transport system substrate-binding protein
MANKKVVKKKTVEKAAPKADVNKSQEIKKVLAATPGKSPKEIADALTAKGVEVTPGYVSTIKTSLKAKKATKKKVSRKKQTSKAAPATGVTFDQLRMAKDMAKQLGGVKNAQEALTALSELVD